MLCTLIRVCFTEVCYAYSKECVYCDNDSTLNLVHTKCFTVWGNTIELVGKWDSTLSKCENTLEEVGKHTEVSGKAH